ncbi:MAG TPA: ABC transporter permease subunit [Ruminiclostridium sp.]|nr:ABC transporter permease subunit [Ruminiclostridium sp.]
MQTTTAQVPKNNSGIRKMVTLFMRQKYLVLMSFPFVIWLIIFSYIPLWGWTMAFQEYKPGLPFMSQKWVGLKYFIMMFKDPDFYLVMRNTLAMSFMSLVVGFTLPVILAILLNEITNSRFRRTIQTVSYLPHFVSWVVVASIAKQMLSLDGPINQALVNLGILHESVQYLAKPELFWAILTATGTWKEIGWNSIIFFAAISGISQELYEAAAVDGAGRFKKMLHITIPGIMPTVLVMLIMAIGNIINAGFESQLLMRNDLVRDFSDTLDLYVLTAGVNSGRFAFGTAIGIFKSVVSIILVFGANRLSGKFSDYKII